MSVKRILLLAGAFLLGSMLWSQTPPVALISGATTSTLTNCGTPTTPSICIVGTGVYVWQNATQGWFLIAPPAAGGIASITVNGGTPLTGPNVALTIPTKATSSTTTTLQ